ncbi:transposase [Galbibacter sp. EGI 63066]|uniref:transposase n=1 Tax=Galbibacter sp. EGI 63066 TaxID=2993559 RepID=UPI002248B26A|nr:transposase [Galbibacter sp. EGI 63066]MCX2682119.1 transposase [Galbibacter sp. EGI 63066]
MLLIAQARKLYGDGNQLELELEKNVFAIDASIIDLCLSMYPWAKFRRNKAAVKLHLQLDLKNSIPCFVHITTGKVHEVNVLEMIDFEKGGFYVYGQRVPRF